MCSSNNKITDTVTIDVDEQFSFRCFHIIIMNTFENKRPRSDKSQLLCRKIVNFLNVTWKYLNVSLKTSNLIKKVLMLYFALTGLKKQYCSFSHSLIHIGMSSPRIYIVSRQEITLLFMQKPLIDATTNNLTKFWQSNRHTIRYRTHLYFDPSRPACQMHAHTRTQILHTREKRA